MMMDYHFAIFELRYPIGKLIIGTIIVNIEAVNTFARSPDLASPIICSVYPQLLPEWIL